MKKKERDSPSHKRVGKNAYKDRAGMSGDWGSTHVLPKT